MMAALMETTLYWLNQIARWLWQPLFVILVGCGLYLTYKLKALQFRKLGYALKLAFTRHDDDSAGDISHFQALMTALAATIGIGNIAGVATAIAIGGMGSLFWLWITSLIGMATKYGEAILAIYYRIKDDRGEMAGGPMYYIERGLGWKWLAICFALFGAITAFFTGNLVQSNSIAAGVYTTFSVNVWITGAALALLTALVLLGGIKSIGRVTEYLVPFMALFYIGGSLIILILRINHIPEAFLNIVRTAFTGQAAIGGFAGSTVLLSIQMGVARGVFSNESGLGSAPIAAAAAKTDHPGRQAIISMTGAFLSTVVCTFTGLAIAVTDVLGLTGPDGKPLTGVPMTIAAFNSVVPFGDYIVVLGSILFGYSTIIGWSYYGEKCFEYLFGTKYILFYRILFSFIVIVGVAIPVEMVWTLADISNAFMALPNLIGVFALSAIIVQQTQSFMKKVQEEQQAKKALNP